MAFPEQPFDVREQRYFLAEIVKVSSIAPREILSLIQERAINPSWTEIALPQGRSVAACQRAYDLLLNPALGPPPSFQFVPQPEQPPANGKSKKKRPAPVQGPPAPGERTIQAQPFATVNTSEEPASFQSPPGAGGEPPHKKRGRPNKEEHDRRVREAAARGEVYVPTKKSKTPRQSLEGQMGEGSSMGSAKKTKRAKASTQNMLKAPEIPARLSSLEATASAADQMSIETQAAEERTIPNVQAPDFSDSERLLVGMEERAAIMEPTTIESSTNIVGLSAPSREPEASSAPPNPLAVTSAEN